MNNTRNELLAYAYHVRARRGTAPTLVQPMADHRNLIQTSLGALLSAYGLTT